MSKMLRTAGMIAGAVALVATGVGAFAAAFTATAAGAAALSATAASVASIASLTAAATSAGAALTAKPAFNERQGVQLTFKIEPGGPIPYVVGRTAVGGTVVHRETFGTDNHYQTYFGILSLGRAKSITTLMDRLPVSFAGTSAIGYYNKWMWQDVQLGASPEARALGHGVTSPPFGSIPAQVPGWSAQHKLSGYAAISWTMLFDTKARRYANGEPAPSWIVEAGYVWDPRLDSTYPGGMGPCRLNDPATHVYSETPALQGLKWRLGIFENGKRIMGVGAPVDLIDVATIVAAANVQEANGWKVGGELNSAMDKHEALKLIDQAGGAEPVPRGARMSLIQRAPKVSIGTITQDMIVEAREVPAMRSRRDRLNGFRAKYRSEAHGWEMVPIAVVEIAEYLAADGRPKTGSGDYPLVQDADQAAALAAYEIFDSREIAPIELVLKPEAIGYRIGDCLTIEAPEYGLSSQKAVVRGWAVDAATGTVTLKFVTETDGKHSVALGQGGTPPPAPGLTFNPPSIAAPAAADWSVAGGTIDDGDYSTPALIVSGAVGNSNADGVVFDYQEVGTSEWLGASIEDPSTTRKIFTDVASDTQYLVGVRYKVGGIIGDRAVEGPVVTGTLSGKALAQALEAALADGRLSRFEKKFFVPQHARDVVERGRLVERAAAYPLPGLIDIEDDAWTAYLAKLDAVDPAFDVMGVDSFLPAGFAEARQAWYAASAGLTFGMDNYVAEKLEEGIDPNLLTVAEKQSVLVPRNAVLEQRWTDLQNLANQNSATYSPTTHAVMVTARTVAGDARSAWLTLRNAIAPPWNSTTEPSTIDRAQFNLTIDAWEAKLWQFGLAIDAHSQANAAVLRADVNATASDDILTPGAEKAAVRLARTIAATTHSFLLTQAAALNVSTANFTAAFNTLDAYIGGLNPAITSEAANTPVNGALLASYRAEFEAQRDILRGQIDKARAGGLVPGAFIATGATVIDGGSGKGAGVVYSDELFRKGVASSAVLFGNVQFGVTLAANKASNVAATIEHGFRLAAGVLTVIENGVDKEVFPGPYNAGVKVDVRYLLDRVVLWVPAEATGFIERTGQVATKQYHVKAILADANARYEKLYATSLASTNIDNVSGTGTGAKANSLAEMNAADATKLNDAFAGVLAAVEDQVLDRGEKKLFLPRIAAIYEQYEATRLRATALGLSTTSLVAAYNTLIAGLPAGWNNANVDTPLVTNLVDPWPTNWTQSGSVDFTTIGDYTRITDNVTTVFENVSRLRAVTAGTTYTLALVVKKDAIPATTRAALLRLQFTGGTGQLFDIPFETSTGQFQAGAGRVVHDLGDDWMFVITATAATGNTGATLQVFPAVATSKWAYTVTAVGSIDVRDVFFVEGGFAKLGRFAINTALRNLAFEAEQLNKSVSETDATRASWPNIDGLGKPDSGATIGSNLVSNATLAELSRNWLLTGPVQRTSIVGAISGEVFAFTPGGIAKAVANDGIPRALGGPIKLTVKAWRLIGAGAAGRFEAKVQVFDRTGASIGIYSFSLMETSPVSGAVSKTFESISGAPDKFVAWIESELTAGTVAATGLEVTSSGFGAYASQTDIDNAILAAQIATPSALFNNPGLLIRATGGAARPAGIRTLVDTGGGFLAEDFGAGYAIRPTIEDPDTIFSGLQVAVLGGAKIILPIFKCHRSEKYKVQLRRRSFGVLANLTLRLLELDGDGDASTAWLWPQATGRFDTIQGTRNRLLSALSVDDAWEATQTYEFSTTTNARFAAVMIEVNRTTAQPGTLFQIRDIGIDRIGPAALADVDPDAAQKLAGVEAEADVTANSIETTSEIGTVFFTYDNQNGDAAAGSVSFRAKRFKGGVDVSADTNFSVTLASGLGNGGVFQYTVDNNAGSPTIGTVTVTAMTGAVQFLIVRSIYDGRALYEVVKLVGRYPWTIVDAKPLVFEQIAWSTAFQPITAPIELPRVNEARALTARVALIAAPGTLGLIGTHEAKVQVSVNNGGWSDAPSSTMTIVGGPATSVDETDVTETRRIRTTTLNIQASPTGSSVSTVRCRIVARNTDGAQQSYMIEGYARLQE